MIPTFPKFKKLELSDRAEIESITRRYPPYSDYNFTSMWCWDTKGEVSLSTLNQNLVVGFTDYISREPFLSFIGSTKVVETAKELIAFSKTKGMTPVLKLVPESSASNFDETLMVTRDEDNFDYILSLENMSSYSGNKYRAKRNFVNRFKKNYKSNVARLDFKNNDVQQELLRVFQRWVGIKGVSIEDAENEYLAISRLLYLDDFKNIYVMGVFVDHKLVGYSINEILDNEYAILHFEKADVSFVGVYSYIMQQTADELLKTRRRYLNYEQDLGLSGLKKGKMQYRPCAVLKKYRVNSLK